MRKYIFSLVLGVGMMMANVGHSAGESTMTPTDITIGGSNLYSITSSQAQQMAGVKQDISNVAAGASTPTEVIVTEKVPGARCFCYTTGSKGPEECPSGTPVQTRKYVCEVDKGLVSFQKMIAQIIRWVVNIVMLLGVLAIVGAGILWAWGSDSEEQTKKAKGWVINIMIGLFILFTFRYILGFLAPWIFV